MGHLNPAAHRLFAAQHGVASVDQLIASGIPRSQLKRLEAAHAIVRLHNTVYRSPSVAVDERTRCAGACLARPGVIIAGPTAGRLWGFRRLPPDQRIHVLAPPASHPVAADWVVPYRTASFHSVDVVERPDGIRVTSRARTAFDLARWLGDEDLLSVIEQAMHDGRITEPEMYAVAIDWVSPRRRWASAYLRQLQRRLPGGAAESHPEVRVAQALARAGVHGLVRQFAIDLPGFGSARFDLAIPDLRWAIEVDVHPRHRETAGALSDRQRDLAAEEEEWQVTRIGRTAYEARFEATIEHLAAEYRTRRAIQFGQRR